MSKDVFRPLDLMDILPMLNLESRHLFLRCFFMREKFNSCSLVYGVDKIGRTFKLMRALKGITGITLGITMAQDN